MPPSGASAYFQLKQNYTLPLHIYIYIYFFSFQLSAFAFTHLRSSPPSMGGTRYYLCSLLLFSRRLFAVTLHRSHGDAHH